ncbi:MAG: Ca2+/H+ antiporter, family [Actinomycetota bacterium]|nr:Ca2+/H+ antiporter, family [Actinomycetota bacterium]
MIDLAIVATTFALILPAELPDKTFIATLVLATRFRHLWVWLGVITAFAVQVLIAVTAGGLLALAPQRLVLGITFVLFAVGAFVMIKGGLSSRAAEQAAADDEAAEISDRADTERALTPAKVFALSFVVLFTAEWGDLSQLLTAGLAARTGEPLSVFLGSWTALVVVSGLAVLAGTWLRSRVPIWRIRLVSGGILTALAIWTAVELVRV